MSQRTFNAKPDFAAPPVFGPYRYSATGSFTYKFNLSDGETVTVQVISSGTTGGTWPNGKLFASGSNEVTNDATIYSDPPTEFVGIVGSDGTEAALTISGSSAQRKGILKFAPSCAWVQLEWVPNVSSANLSSGSAELNVNVVGSAR